MRSVEQWDHVLLVDDDADIRECVGAFLETCQLRVTYAENGKAALDFLRLGDLPHLILLDLSMPEMDGYAFRKEQLIDPVFKQIPVTVLTADQRPPEETFGDFGFVRKPFDLDDLIESLGRHVKISAGGALKH